MKRPEPPTVELPETELPLLDLFLNLREAGLPLGIDEYRVLIHALQLGFGTENTEALRRLCHTLWIKTPQDRRLFNYHFDLMLQRAPVSPTSIIETTPHQASSESAPVTAPPPSQSTIPSTSDLSGTVQSSEPSSGSFAPLLDDSQFKQAAEAVMEAALEAPATPAKRFLLSGLYYPVTQRQMKQQWRYLRRLVKEGLPTELNIEETVKKVGRDGILLELVLEPRRINTVELLLLIDQKGSMVPFHYLSRSLVETATQGGHLGRAGIYYFQNVPRNHLYLTPTLIDSKTTPALLGGLHPERTVALIFSDAGAARGHWNPKRFDLTQRFLDQLRIAVRRIAWLNPMPQSRWSGTTAGEIARLVPMFEFSRRGMDTAIDLLRGRWQPASGRS